MEYFYTTIAFVYGAILGSFSGVLLERIPRKEDFVKKPSHCVSCDTVLKPYHNIPIVSWIILRGKCAYCKEKIPKKLFLIELFTGLLFAGVIFLFGVSITMIVAVIVLYLLFIIYMGKTAEEEDV